MRAAESQMLCSDGEHQCGKSSLSGPPGLHLGWLSRLESLPKFSSKLPQKGRRDISLYFFKLGYMISALCNSVILLHWRLVPG